MTLKLEYLLPRDEEENNCDTHKETNNQFKMFFEVLEQDNTTFDEFTKKLNPEIMKEYYIHIFSTLFDINSASFSVSIEFLQNCLDFLSGRQAVLVLIYDDLRCVGSTNQALE